MIRVSSGRSSSSALIDSAKSSRASRLSQQELQLLLRRYALVLGAKSFWDAPARNDVHGSRVLRKGVGGVETTHEIHA